MILVAVAVVVVVVLVLVEPAHFDRRRTGMTGRREKRLRFRSSALESLKTVTAEATVSTALQTTATADGQNVSNDSNGAGDWR